jgi:hypothetical protein
MRDVVPHYWMFESSGVLRPVVLAYLNGQELTPAQCATMRAYLRQWMTAPWQGPNVDWLRASVGSLTSRANIARWLDIAVGDNIDPL